MWTLLVPEYYDYMTRFVDHSQNGTFVSRTMDGRLMGYCTINVLTSTSHIYSLADQSRENGERMLKVIVDSSAVAMDAVSTNAATREHAWRRLSGLDAFYQTVIKSSERVCLHLDELLRLLHSGLEGIKERASNHGSKIFETELQATGSTPKKSTSRRERSS
eukprot:gene35077-43248_t